MNFDRFHQLARRIAIQQNRFNQPRFKKLCYWMRWGHVGGLLIGLVGNWNVSSLAQLPFEDAEVRTAEVRTAEVRAKQAATCPEPVLSRLVRHQVAAGETIDSIAQQYRLLPTTLMGMNPVLQRGAAPIGAELVIPPYNGIRVTAPAGSSWRDLARQYGVRADVLFEANGCETVPTTVFVPGANWSPVPSPTPPSASSPISRYPLPELAAVVLAYGWQVNPRTNTVEFHSGVNLAVSTETPVLAVGAGTVAFAGEQAGYGQLVVINHAQGLQTRYAQLETISVQVGQQVEASTPVGTVGSAGTPQAYLHFEVRSNSHLGWVAQDPGAYIQELRIGNPFRR